MPEQGGERQAWAVGPALTAKSPVLLAASPFLKQTTFVLWKLLNTAYIFFWLIYGAIDPDVTQWKLFTWWSYWVNGIYFALSFLTALRLRVSVQNSSSMSYEDLCRLPSMTRPLDWLEKMQLLFQYPSAAAAPVVLLVFWGFLYNGGALSYTDWNAHLLNLFQVTVDMFLIASPYRFAHLWTVVLYAVTYSVANILYYVLGDIVVYDILDWSDPGSAAIVLAVLLLVATPLSFLACCGVARLRQNCSKRGGGSHQQNLLDQDVEVGVPAVAGTKPSR